MTPPADRLGPPRPLHPLAWWGWGLLVCAAATRTTNPVHLLVLLLVVAVVVAARREVGGSVGIGLFVGLAATAVGIRLVSAAVLGNGVAGSTVVLELPSVPLPSWMAGVRLGGPVSLESLVAAARAGLQLAVLLLALGACNVLADPRRLLRLAPATLHGVGTALVVALTVVPQLAQEARQVRSARRLRGHDRHGLRAAVRLVVPVLQRALDRSLELAASMEVRGYGRLGPSPAVRRRATVLTVGGLAGVLVGLVGLLTAGVPQPLAAALLAGGCLGAVVALRTAPGQPRRQVYRPDRWRLPETLVLASAAPAPVALAAAAAAGDPGLAPAQTALVLPPVAPGLVAALLVAAAPALLAPRPPRRAALEDRARSAGREHAAAVAR